MTPASPPRPLTGWQLRERRQLLPGLPGPVCALSAAGGDRLLAATERPLAQWIGAAASSERPEQLRPGVLQRGLTAARRPSGPVLHPTLTWPAAGRPTGPPAGLLWPAEGPETEPPPLSAPAEAGDGVIDLTSAPWAARAGGSEHGSNPFLAPQVAAEQQQQQAAAPAIPSMLMLTTPTHMPLAEGLSLLPSLPPQQQPLRQGAAAAAAAAGGGGSSADGGGRGAAVEGGHATLLWLDPPLCAGPGGGGLGHRRTASWSPPGVGGVSSPREPALELALAADLAEVRARGWCRRGWGMVRVQEGRLSNPFCRALSAALPACSCRSLTLRRPHPMHPQTCGGYTVLASSRAAPVLAVCRLGSQGLQQVAAVPLAAPSGVPDSCTVRIRGLTVGPAAEGGGSGLAVWALLAAAQLGAAAPFLSAALSSRIYGSSKQQLWLCCYHLQLPGRGAALSPVLSRMGSSLAVEPSALAAQAAAAAAEQPTVAAADAMSQAAASEAGASGAAPAVGGPAAAAAAAVAAEAATGEAPAAAAAPLTPEPGSVPRSPPSATAAPAAGAAAAAAVGSTSAAEAAPAPLPAAAAPLPGGQAAVDAVLALQRAVEGLRQEVNTRLDTLDADLSELLQTLRLPPTDGDAA